MTDYIYSLSLASQTRSFLMSLGFGFIMGIIYEIFRLVRICISNGKKMQIAFDIAFFILLSFLTFIFFITVNEGEIRLYLLLGEAIGFCVYSLSLGAVVFTYGEIWVRYIRKAIKKFFLILFAPVKYAIKFLKKIFGKLLKKGSKRSENIKNKSKLLLKVNRHLLYNLCTKEKNPANRVSFNEKDV
jgi:spore cortex biosynthesis protein YabQ